MITPKNIFKKLSSRGKKEVLNMERKLDEISKKLNLTYIEFY